MTLPNAALRYECAALWSLLRTGNCRSDRLGEKLGQERNAGIHMTKPIFERDPSDPEREKINPMLKLALELGPLVVFFFGNSRGEWLAGHFPVLADVGGPIFIATALFMAATVVALAASWMLIMASSRSDLTMRLMNSLPRPLA